jgi:hypothetical protein
MPWLGHQVLVLSSLSCLSGIYWWKVQSFRSSRRTLQRPAHRGLDRPIDVAIGRSARRGQMATKRKKRSARTATAASVGARYGVMASTIRLAASRPSSRARTPSSGAISASRAAKEGATIVGSVVVADGDSRRSPNAASVGSHAFPEPSGAIQRQRSGRLRMMTETDEPEGT